VRTTKAQGNVLGNGPTKKCEGQRPDLTTKAQKTLLQTAHDLTPIHTPRKNAKGVTPSSPGLVARQKTYPGTNTTTPIRPNKKLSTSQTLPTLPTFQTSRPSDLPTFRPSDLPTFRLHVATRRFNRSPRFQSWVDAPHKNKSHPGRVFFIPAGISACSRWFVRNERHHRIQVPKVNASRQGFLHPGRDLSL
jgi:hypothetical protein